MNPWNGWNSETAVVIPQDWANSSPVAPEKSETGADTRRLNFQPTGFQNRDSTIKTVSDGLRWSLTYADRSDGYDV